MTFISLNSQSETGIVNVEVGVHGCGRGVHGCGGGGTRLYIILDFFIDHLPESNHICILFLAETIVVYQVSD